MTPSQRHAAHRAGVRPYVKPIKNVGRVQILRNYEKWKQADSEQIRVELGRQGA
jgi:hypothetical protein